MPFLLMGCGLRRGELLALRVDATQLREERWVIADLMGRARHIRTLPIPAWVKTAIDEWKAASGITEGAIFRSINKNGRVWGNGMTAKVLWEVVRDAASTCAAPAPVMPSCGRPTGPDPILARACFYPDHRALSWLQTEIA